MTAGGTGLMKQYIKTAFMKLSHKLMYNRTISSYILSLCILVLYKRQDLIQFLVVSHQ